ncbi:MAG TPA: hypothetical protein VGX50_15360, partial [Longimicrobium sp.]|nr:hypothetical protein [Longimicrobium sp.]
MRTLSVQLRTSCSKCGSPLPLNAMTPRLACSACGGQNQLDDDFWSAVLGDDDLGSGTIITAGRTVELEVSRAADPACAKCGAGIPAGDALAAADAGAINCAACGARTPLRVPPASWVL